VKNERSISRARAYPLSFGFDSDSDAVFICIMRGILMAHFYITLANPSAKRKNKFRCMKINMPMLRTSRALVAKLELKIKKFPSASCKYPNTKLIPYNYGVVAKVDL